MGESSFLCLMACSSLHYIFQDCNRGYRKLNRFRVSINKKHSVTAVTQPREAIQETPLFLQTRAPDPARDRDGEKAMGIRYSEPICKAAYEGELHQVYQLLKADATNLNAQDEFFGETPLIAACRRGNVSTVKYLLDQKADVSIRNKKQRTCLHYIARGAMSWSDYIMIVILMPILLIGYLILTQKQKQFAQLLEMVLNSKADVNAVDYKGNTALHYACLCKRFQLVQLLLEANADIFIRNKDGETPLDIAIRLKYKSIIAILEKCK